MRRLFRLIDRHRRLFAILGWACFALGCAIHARFIDLPDWAAIPFWVGVGATLARWAVIEPVRQRLAQDAAAEARHG
ncbi:hypothetical protein [Sphingomicrobium aestuariivivum]|uniref:hypothetical protein n=1 Tax=Sphingomicrobium aestuariivivum TaxID=1582356 RepID=UPI001FD702B3|nr:hypothetical protein [Sphingomicrobium aestuariivivum]MCJ8190281.1 hypothetical protein [Sphingomicrobium aestuariivivum]